MEAAEPINPEPVASLPSGEGSDSRRRSRRLAWLYVAGAVVLLPWIVFLAETLPRRVLDDHYRMAWVGFDCILVLALAATAYMAFRVDPRIQFTATVTATLLVVDAWFDIITSSGRNQTLEAVVLALVFEIPAALYSIRLARDVGHRVLRRAWEEERSVNPARQGPSVPSADG